MATTHSVLIIDDDERTHTLLEDALETLGIDLHFATNSDDGLRLAQQLNPALILLDLRLPAPSLPGWEIVPLLKENPELAHIPVVVMSASGGEAIMRAMKAGADDFIDKPFSIMPLRQKVIRVVGLAQN
ncbi:MAG: response regulator [Anaerolineae bacterium]|nr:response regulator [Anaerolineae bacterium]MDQ7034644.1 response regulator [Anaerolineae bacterium]